jgi:N-acetylmuramoyl-L-alanine amidase
MNLKTIMFTRSDCYREGMAKKDNITPCGVMWHSTGANNPTLKRYVAPDDGTIGNNRWNNHWNQPRKRRVCPHAWIGKLADGSIATVQCLPWTLRGWHSGSGQRGNANTLGYIGFEICEDNLRNRDYAMAAYKEAVELTAYLCKKFGLDPLEKNRHGLPTVIDHAEGHRLGIASNHGDVMHWFKRYGVSLDGIRRDVAVELARIQNQDKPKQVVPFVVRLEAGTPYYHTAAAKHYAGKIKHSTNYTIVEERNGYGRLKSGAGWVKLGGAPPKPAANKVEHWAAKNILKQGAKGKLVECVQAHLMMRGYDVREIDGDFGHVTSNAVREYQADTGLTVDGAVGKPTWVAMFRG